MQITEDKTIASVVAQNIEAAHVFKKYGIDFCCGGHKSLEKACSENAVDYNALRMELNGIGRQKTADLDFDNWNLVQLIDHIVHRHHSYVEESIKILLQYANKVAKVHGPHYKELLEIRNLVHSVANELTAHMQKEEVVLFPYVKALYLAKSEGRRFPSAQFGSVQNPIQMMQNEHESAGDIFKTIAQLTCNFIAPKDSCTTFRALYSKLQEFEEDLHQHIHLENNILFPKAIQLEQHFN